MTARLKLCFVGYVFCSSSCFVLFFICVGIVRCLERHGTTSSETTTVKELPPWWLWIAANTAAFYQVSTMGELWNLLLALHCKGLSEACSNRCFPRQNQTRQHKTVERLINKSTQRHIATHESRTETSRTAKRLQSYITKGMKVRSIFKQTYFLYNWGMEPKPSTWVVGRASTATTKCFRPAPVFLSYPNCSEWS